MDIIMKQGDTLNILITDEENPIIGMIFLEFCEAFFSVDGKVQGLDQHKNDVKLFVKRS